MQTQLEPGTCRSCNAAILWAVMACGTQISLDAEPNPGGNIVIRDRMALQLQTRTLFSRDEGETVYMQHWATCPHGAKYRKKKR